MRLANALEDSERLAEELLALIDLPLISDVPRVVIANTACTLALEHWQAIRLQLAAGFLSSALVVHRAQFEATVRSIWLTFCASEAEISKLSATLDLDSEQAAKNLSQTQQMMERIEKSAPANAYAALARFKAHSWKALNSYAHAGIHPLRRHAEGYPEFLSQSVLCNANGLAIFSGMQAVALSGLQPLQQQVLDLGMKYPTCMPAPL